MILKVGRKKKIPLLFRFLIGLQVMTADSSGCVLRNQRKESLGKINRYEYNFSI